MKAIMDKIFSWCDENPTMAMIVAAWLMGDLFAVSATLIGATDVCVWYGEGSESFFCSGIMLAALDAFTVWFLIRRLKWWQILCLVFLGFACIRSIWSLFSMFGGLDNFWYEILDLPILVCSGLAFALLLGEVRNPEKPVQKTAAQDWIALAGLILLSFCVGICWGNMMEDDEKTDEYMRQAAIEGGASAKRDLADWVMENNEGVSKEEAREAVEDFIRESKEEAEQEKLTSLGRVRAIRNANEERKNMRGLVFLYVLAIIGPFVIAGWFCKKYDEYKKNGSEGENGGDGPGANRVADDGNTEPSEKQADHDQMADDSIVKGVS